MGFFIDDTEVYLYNNGANAYSYRFLGCHHVKLRRKSSHRFALWAPHAKSVSVVGDFNEWDSTRHLMEQIAETGIWQIHIDDLSDGMIYKYQITTPQGTTQLKSDPFAFYSEVRPNTASRILDISNYKWSDSAYLKKRKGLKFEERPISIYEMHLGSWKGEKSYKEIADDLIPYLSYMGFTHVEFMPLTEFPFDGSWGYQVAGYFCATSRYGTALELMEMIDRLHQAGIGVIMDWVPAHFPRDAHGLRCFDGLACYEHADPRAGEQPQWGTMLFNYGRGQVKSFLMSSAMFWADMFHVDGLRADAVSCMLYLDYGKNDGEWIANKYGGRDNLDAKEFLQDTSVLLHRDFPGIIFCAEESTSYPFVTRSPEEGGLGFDLKWNMGWMNDMLEYMSMDSIFRKWHHSKLTFSLVYAFSENFILPFSHDEVVHGKRSLIGRMPGNIFDQFGSLRLLYSYMFAHPGKKLMFMGDEIAQFIEWRYYEPIEWQLLDYGTHQDVQKCVKELNNIYTSEGALHQIDNSWDGFKWINPDDQEHSVISFARKDKTGKEIICCVFNFTPIEHSKYRVGVPRQGRYKVIFDSQGKGFGGNGKSCTYKSKPIPCNGFENSIDIDISPYMGAYLKWATFNDKEKAADEKSRLKFQLKDAKSQLLSLEESKNGFLDEGELETAMDLRRIISRAQDKLSKLKDSDGD